MQRTFSAHAARARAALVATLATSAALGVAATACGRDDRVPRVQRDSAAGVIDSAPATTLKAVATLLTDQNVFALLDTAYANIIATDRLALKKASDPRLKQFASRSVSQNTLARSGARATGERLQIAPVLPDQNLLEDQKEAMQKLGAQSGKAFDDAYLDYTIQSRKDLLGEVDDALGSNTRQEAVRTFLRDLRTNIESDMKTAQQLKDRA